jgi:hypothetical protein
MSPIPNITAFYLSFSLSGSEAACNIGAPYNKKRNSSPDGHRYGLAGFEMLARDQIRASVRDIYTTM